MATTTPRRGGFTLIELLVVISILAILTALAVGGFFRVRNAQTQKAAEGQVSNRNTAFHRMWTAARDQADKEFKDDATAGHNGAGSPLSVASTLTNYCGGDRDRARAVWLYTKLKAEFPQTFWQCGTPFQQGFATTTPRDAVSLAYNTNVWNVPSNAAVSTANTALAVPTRRLFASNRTIMAVARQATDPALTDPDEAFNQSAALLYLMLTEKGARGEVDDATGITVGTVTAGGEPMQVFLDVYGQPIGFVRWATNGDLQDTQNGFSRKGAASPDPFDPTGRLNKAWPNRAAAAVSLFTYHIPALPPAPNTRRAVPPQVWNVNWQPTLLSKGGNKTVEYSIADVDFAPPDTSKVTGLNFVRDTDDDILGYRLNREGNSGN